MRIVTRFMRFLFRHFYHTFAWTYDFVASTVSLGRWFRWIDAVLPFVQGKRVLEIGFGTGYLQEKLSHEKGRIVVGLDESIQMERLAHSRLVQAGILNQNLTRGLAQKLPFASASFNTVVATFPAEYIFAAETMSEVYRILDRDGCFIVLPAALIIGRKALDRFAAWLFKITGQAPPQIQTVIHERFRHPFELAGFKPQFQTLEINASVVLIVVATK